MKKIIFLLSIFLGVHITNAQDLSKLSFPEFDNIIAGFISKGQYIAGIPYAEGVRDKAKAEFGTMDSIYGKYTMDLGYFYHEAGKYDKTEQFYWEGVNVFSKTLGETHFAVGEGFMNLASLYQEMGKYEKAEPLFGKAIKITEKALGKAHPNYALMINNFALFYHEIGQYEKAEKLYLECKELDSKAFGEKSHEYASSLNNLAGLYRSMNDYDKAELLFVQAKNLRAATLGEEHPSYATTLNNLALVYQEKGQPELAEPLLLESQNIWVKILGKEHHRYSTSLNNLALFYQQKNDYVKAEQLFLEAKNIASKILGAQHPEVASRINNLAVLYKDMKSYEKAEQLFLESARIQSIAMGLEHPRSSSYLTDLADFYWKMGKLDTALSYSLKSIDANSAQIDSSFYSNKSSAPDWNILDKTNYYSNSQFIASISVLLGIIKAQYDQTKDKKKLELHYQLTQIAIRFNERIRHDFTSENNKLRNLAKNSFFVLKGIETGIALANKDYEKEAFSFAELNKGVLLMDAIHTSYAHEFGELPDSILSQEKKLQTEQNNLKASLLKNLPKNVEDSLTSILNHVNLNIDVFTKKLKAQYPKYMSIKYENKTANAEEIQKLLDDKTALLEYVIGDSVIYIFYIDRNNIKLNLNYLSYKILSTKIKNFHTILSDYKSITNNSKLAYEQYIENAHWFYTNLIAPAIPNKAKNISKLIIVSDGGLGHLPFEAFLTKPAPQKETSYAELSYLVNDYQISYNYSATLWKEYKEKQHPTNNGQILAMAANYASASLASTNSAHSSTKLDWRLPIYQRMRENLSPLPEAQKEVQTLAESFNGFFAFDKEASEKNFKEKAGDYAIIHLAMHGLLDAKNPILSSLAFTEDGDSLENNFLQAYEISKMKLNADLVILSACETGFGKFQSGNGIASLAQAFAYAGAPAMIVSLWQVNDYATSAIMKNLYQNLADGMEKDEALQQTKIKYLKDFQGIATHPAFWSPFILMGNTDAVYLKTKGGWFWWGIGGSILVLGGIAFAIRSREKE